MSGKAGVKHANYGLDIARCAAVSLVFFSHSILNLYTLKIPYLWYWVFIGIELFFSLSGFLIGRIFLDIFNRFHDDLSFKHIWNFWIRRWFRTLPLYFILYCIYLVIYNKWMYPVHVDWRYFLFVQSVTTPPNNIFGESWSLAIEEWFYFVFPVLIFLAYLLNKMFTSSSNINKVFIPVVLLVIITQIIIRSFYPDCNSWGCIAVLFHFDAAAYGLIGAYISKHKKDIKASQALYIMMAGLALCIFAFFIKTQVVESAYPAQLYFPANGIGTTLIIIGLYYYRFPKKYTLIPYISKISYSIYLVHLTGVILPLQEFAKGTVLEKTLLLWLISLILTLLIASITYKLIEAPFLAIRERRFPALYK